MEENNKETVVIIDCLLIYFSLDTFSRDRDKIKGKLVVRVMLVFQYLASGECKDLSLCLLSVSVVNIWLLEIKPLAKYQLITASKILVEI